MWEFSCRRRLGVIHQQAKSPAQENALSNPVDGHDVPVPHFGVVNGKRWVIG